MSFLRKLVGKDKVVTTTKARDKAKKQAWEKWELDILDASFKDLAYRSSCENAIDKDTFLKFFLNVPGMLGERLFHVFDADKQGIIDHKHFLDGLYRFSRGTYEDKLRFVFDMFDLENTKTISKRSLQTMLNSVLFAAHTINSEVEITDGKINTLIQEGNDICTEEERKNDAMTLYSFSKWLSKHPLMLEVLDTIFAGHECNPNSVPATHSLSAVLVPRSNDAEIEMDPRDNHSTEKRRRSVQQFLQDDVKDTAFLKAQGVRVKCGACEFQMFLEHCYHCGKRLAAKSKWDSLQCATCGPIFLNNSLTFCMSCGHDLRAQLNGKVEPSFMKSLRFKRDLTKMEGKLYKTGSRFGKILHRYYIIRDNFLYCYNSQGDMLKGKQPTSILFLEGCYVESMNHEEKNTKLKYGLEIIITETPRRSRSLYAKTSIDRAQWLKAIRNAANIHNIEDYYDIGKELGVGRFSTVKLATSKVSGEKFAVKIMDKTNLSEKEHEALRTEVAVLKLLQHPNIISMKNVFETRRQIHIVMTYVHGGDLFDVLSKKKTYSECAARALVWKLLNVMMYLHNRGIVHRDLKPENIMMDTDSKGNICDDGIILADFGLSKFALPTELMDIACGTLAYVAPEVLTNSGYGKEVDMWSVGIILYLIIRGRLPFDDKNQEGIVKKTVEGVIPFDKAFDDITPECVDLIEQLLQIDPSKRISAQDAIKHPWFSADVGNCRSGERLTDAAETQDVLDELDSLIETNDISSSPSYTKTTIKNKTITTTTSSKDKNKRKSIIMRTAIAEEDDPRSSISKSVSFIDESGVDDDDDDDDVLDELESLLELNESQTEDNNHHDDDIGGGSTRSSISKSNIMIEEAEEGATEFEMN